MESLLIQMFFSVTLSTLGVLFLSLPLAAIGYQIVCLLGYKTTPPFSLLIAYGLSFVVFIGYYGHLLHLPLSFVFIALIISGVWLLFVNYYKYFYKKSFKKNSFNLIFNIKNYLLILLMAVLFFLF